MSDECTCEKCQAGASIEVSRSVWPVSKAEGRDEGRSQRSFYLVVTDAGISLRQQSYEI